MAQQDICNSLIAPANCPTEPMLVWPGGPNEPELAELAEGRGRMHGTLAFLLWAHPLPLRISRAVGPRVGSSPPFSRTTISWHYPSGKVIWRGIDLGVLNDCNKPEDGLKRRPADLRTEVERQRQRIFQNSLQLG